MERGSYKQFVRLDKRQARKLYDAGFNVRFLPCNLNPDNDFSALAIDENIFMWEQYPNFDSLVAGYTHYNCSTQNGRYPAFYTETRTFIHFQFADGSNPYYYNGSGLDCFRELERWAAEGWDITCLKPCFYMLRRNDEQPDF